MLDRLVEDGQVERVRDESDARKRLIRTTKKNRALHGAYSEASDEMTEIYYRGISETEIDRFERTLAKILANLEEASRA
jgi:DNA-binding MarR family transcriptional regulator